LTLALHRSARALVPVIAVAALVLAPASADARSPAQTSAHELSGAVDGMRTFRLGRAATHVALHWRGADAARVRVAFARRGGRFARRQAVELDEVGEQVRNGRTYGAVMAAHGVRAVRVWTDRPLRDLAVLALKDRGRPAAHSSSHLAQPGVITRAGWGADESLRYDSAGNEVWPPAFYPVQKLIVHHTAGRNDDPDPPATIRSIYYYHAVTQGWGDIGYNFLVDEAGNVYEGRWSRQYADGEQPTGEDLSGNGVTGAHASGFNSGTVGIALLGTLTDRAPAAAARDALERFLAWNAERHGLDPRGSSLYTNPVNGTQKTFPNIAGHRDVNATECPGGSLYSALPSIRDRVAALIAGTPPPPIVELTARGYKVRGLQRADLSWSGATSASVDVYRNGTRLTTTANDGLHTDAINRKGSATYTYKVCEAGTATCSAQVSVSF
jgi:hypothetical protein